MSNQLIDPRQTLALNNYTNPKSPTFANLSQSLQKAGFAKSYAITIADRKPEWLTSNLIHDIELIQKAEKNLHKYANMIIADEDKNAIDKSRIQVDVSKFILKTLAKQKYSENGEDKQPQNIQINMINYNDDTKRGEFEVVTILPKED